MTNATTPPPSAPQAKRCPNCNGIIDARSNEDHYDYHDNRYQCPPPTPDASLPQTPRKRMFPIMQGVDIPWEVIAPFEKQAQTNHSQSLQRLAERGGLSEAEAVAILEQRHWRPILPKDEARKRLREIVDAHENSELQVTKRENDALQRDLATLKAERDEAREQIKTLRNHGPTCMICNWTNCGCLNVAESGDPAKWICHGCIKNAIDELGPLRQKYSHSEAKVFELTATLKATHEELGDALRADKERLDWLEKYNSVYGLREAARQLGYAKMTGAPNVRAAIDKARAATK